MRTWSVALGTRAHAAVADAASQLLGAVGTDCFDQALLEAINGSVFADSMCAYRLSRSGPPEKYCSQDWAQADSTAPSWLAYRSGIYREDETFAEAFDQAGTSPLVISHLTAQEIRYAPHRNFIYDRHELLDRLSVSSAEPRGELLAINIYRRRRDGHFNDFEIARFEELSSVLLAAVRQNARLGRSSGVSARSPAQRVACYERLLERERPLLTARERSVCARLLAGMMYEGIAADLGIGVTTAKTYRQRAFDRLGIHFRSELLAIALDAPRASAGAA